MMTATAKRPPLAADLDHILIHTEGLWEELRGKAVFITGGTGFFGRWLLESFVAANHQFSLGAQAVVLTRNPGNFRRAAEALAGDEFVQLVNGDVQTLGVETVQSQLGRSAPEQFSHVIHAASETGEPANRDNPAKVLETLFTGTRRTLDFAARTGVKSFLLASSGAVYGEQPTDLSRVPENYPGAPDVRSPMSAYGTGKRVAELLCNAQGRGSEMNCKIARCFAFVGPHLALDAHYAIGNFIRDALEGKPIQVKGDGTPLRSYLYAADLAIWLWTLLLNPSATGTYNVGSDDAHSIREIAACVSRNSSFQPPVNVAREANASRPAARYVPDISRAQRELGLRVWTPLDAAVRKTIRIPPTTKDNCMKTDWGKPLFILEMANNHMGDVEHGRRIIREFAEIAKDFDYEFAFKLQYRELDTFIHPDYRTRMDVKFVKRFSETRLKEADFLALKDEMNRCGFKTMCTPFDEPSVDLIAKHGYDYLKIGSCSFTDWPLLERIASTNLPIVASAGGASWEDIDRVVSFFDHRQKAVTLMHCVAQYPTETKDLQLNQIELMRQRYPQLRVGFSTHENPDDNEVILAAIGKGATVFERHVAVTTEKYQSNAYSSSPAQFKKWLLSARKGFELCGVQNERMAGTPAEIAQLVALRRGIFAKRKINPGERLTPEDYFLAMPSCEGQVLANHISKYRFFTAKQAIEPNAPVMDSTVTSVDHQSNVRAILQDVKKLLKKSRATLPSLRSDLEISHHYGIEKFQENGAVMLNFINREYCKKLLVMLPGQRHPEHAHKQKEETFYIVYGDITIALDGEEKTYQKGDLVLVNRGVKHRFATKTGVIFEEISSTHYKNDSYYTDPAVMQNGSRKTLLTYWMD